MLSHGAPKNGACRLSFDGVSLSEGRNTHRHDWLWCAELVTRQESMLPNSANAFAYLITSCGLPHDMHDARLELHTVRQACGCSTRSASKVERSGHAPAGSVG